MRSKKSNKRSGESFEHETPSDSGLWRERPRCRSFLNCYEYASRLNQQVIVETYAFRVILRDEKNLTPQPSQRLLHTATQCPTCTEVPQVIPKLQPQRNADNEIDVAATLNALDKELSFTLGKLRNTESLVALARHLDDPQFQELKSKAPTSDETMHLLIDTINDRRCVLLGELTRIGCAEGRAANWPPSFFAPPPSVKALKPEPERPQRGPASPQDWCDVAADRASDAQAMLTAKRTVGSVYMAGYAIECSLKAFLRQQGKKIPTSGGAGHDLSALWKASGFTLRDLKDVNGARTYFVENWSTDLRYHRELMDTTLEASDLLNGAGVVVSFIQTRAKRMRGHR